MVSERRIKSKSKKSKHESSIQKEAREYYYALGNGRSQLLVAQHFKKSIQSMGLWSSKFKWVEYAKAQDAKGFKKETKLLVKELKRCKDDLKGLVATLIAKFKQNIESEKIQCNNIQDLERISKLFLLLEGEATDIEQRKVIFEDVSTKDELEESRKKETEAFQLYEFDKTHSEEGS